MTWQDVIHGDKRYSVEQGDCIAFMDQLPESSVDLVFGSPPYGSQRTYGIDAVYTTESWVEWMLRVTAAAVRVCRGLVLWVVSGSQENLCYQPFCEGLAWEWWKRGNQLWRPCIWWKVDADEGGSGIPGSGGKQWLRNDWEYVLAFKREGWLPWADNTAMGHEPVYSSVGGAMSNRTKDGQRINKGVGQRLADERTKEWGGKFESIGNRAANGKRKYKKVLTEMSPPGARGDNGEQRVTENRPMPKIANPGNCVIVKARVGGGHIGDRRAHENEAPFPETLAEFFVRSFCPPGGICVDCFSGSGTTMSECIRWGRRFVGCDLRQSQVSLALRRVADVTPTMFAD